jgi:predicted RNA-binding Zn-ribbon protein involved in translation (DUF1610 family)
MKSVSENMKVSLRSIPFLFWPRCPGCGARRLERLNWLRATILVEGLRAPGSWTYYRCRNCRSHFKKALNGAWETPTDSEWEQYVVAAVPHVAAHKNSSQHRGAILSSARCGCFYCLAIFSPAEVERWVDEEQTALCPRCGIDSVIGSSAVYRLVVAFLRRMHDYWF